MTRTLLTKRIKLQGFIIFDDYGNRFDEFASQMRKWVRDGSVKFREDIVDGLEKAPQGIVDKEHLPAYANILRDVLQNGTLPEVAVARFKVEAAKPANQTPFTKRQLAKLLTGRRCFTPL